MGNAGHCTCGGGCLRGLRRADLQGSKEETQQKGIGCHRGCGVIGKVVNVTADESVMVDGKIDMSKVNAIAFDPYTHGYYKVTERVGEAFRDGLKLKK